MDVNILAISSAMLQQPPVKVSHSQTRLTQVLKSLISLQPVKILPGRQANGPNGATAQLEGERSVAI